MPEEPNTAECSSSDLEACPEKTRGDTVSDGHLVGDALGVPQCEASGDEQQRDVEHATWAIGHPTNLLHVARVPEEAPGQSTNMRGNFSVSLSMRHVMQNTTKTDTRVTLDMSHGHLATKRLKVLPFHSLPNQRPFNIHQEEAEIFDIDTGASKRMRKRMKVRI